MNQKVAEIIPQYVKPFLWSFDTEAIDLLRDKERIITNVLNLGTEEALQWLFTMYSRHEIKEIIECPRPGEWNKKSLNYWAIMFDVSPQVRPRLLSR